MEADRTIQFQITFLRPSRWRCKLLDVDERSLADESRFLFLEEAYIWEPAESIWDAVEKTDTDQLRELLLEGFSPDNKPEDRGIHAFRNILEQIKVIVVEGRAEWKLCQQLDEDGDVNLRANLLLSFLHHLTWLCDVFADVPGVSITVR